jgi:hypothetical protein
MTTIAEKITFKIKANKLRIAKLKAKGETMNSNIIKKLERQNRAFEAQL